MAKIRNSNPKQSGGGYDRLLGDPRMAKIFVQAQSTIISNGTELEKIISNIARTIDDLDLFIENCDKRIVQNGSYLCTKKIVKKSSYSLPGHEPDFIAFVINDINDMCYVVELKDGDAFDTKKSLAEKEMLELFVNHLAVKIPFRTKYYICSFNQLDKEKIVLGFKSVFRKDEVMTGKEFCEILRVNYDEIVNLRKEDTIDNFNFVVEKLYEIEAVRKQFAENNRKHIAKDEFYNFNEE